MATNTTDKNTLKSWFKKGLKPLEVQFHAWMDSYWHKSEQIPTASVEGLEKVLNHKAESSAVDTLVQDLKEHKEDVTFHKTEVEQGKLDHLAENPNNTYATKEELEDSNEFNCIIIDISREDWLLEEYDQYLTEQFDTITDFTKPFLFKITERTEDGKEYSCFDLVHVQENRKPKDKNFFNVNVYNQHIIDTISGSRIKMNYNVSSSSSSVHLINVTYQIGQEVIFLYENDDNVINTNDLNGATEAGIASDGWDEFYKALKGKRFPAVYLKSEHSEVFCPVEYHFSPSPSNSEYFEGIMKLHYFQEENGNIKLYTETRQFDKFEGFGSFFLKSPKDLGGLDLMKKEFNHIEINLSLRTEEEGLNSQELLNSLKQQFREIKDKTDLYLFKIKIVNKLNKEYIDYDFVRVDNVSKGNYNFEIIVRDKFICDSISCCRLKLIVMIDETDIEIGFDLTTAVPGDEVIFLVENNDNIIDSADLNLCTTTGCYTLGWQDFYRALRDKRWPAVYLKSSDSDEFCPVEYYFTPLEDGSFKGTMKIHYLKKIENQLELWLETRKFDSFKGLSGQYNFDGSPIVEKFPIDSSSNTFILNRSDLIPGWENNETIKEALTVQLKTFKDLNRPLRLVVKNNNQGEFYPEITYFKPRFRDKDNYCVIFSVKWPKEFYTEIGCDQSRFSIGIGDYEEINDIVNEFFPELHTIFLYEDSNHVITGSDFDSANPLARSVNWQLWDDLLKVGIMPVVYLRSALSEHYCLVEYKHFYNEVSHEYDTDMEISYRKEVDGQLQLWIERRYFKGSVMLGYFDGENFDVNNLKLTKIPLTH